MINRNVFADASFVLYPGSSFYWSWDSQNQYWWFSRFVAFDEGSGKVAEDSSGNDRYGEVGKALKWIDGEFGKAVEFDGWQNYILIEHDDAFNLEADDFSVGCWMQAENKDAYIVSGLNKTVQFSLVII